MISVLRYRKEDYGNRKDNPAVEKQHFKDIKPNEERRGGFYKGKSFLTSKDIKGLSTEVLRTRIGMVFPTADRISVQYREESVIRPEISWN